MKTVSWVSACYNLDVEIKRETLGTDGVPSTDSRFPGENRTGRLSMALGTQKKKKKKMLRSPKFVLLTPPISYSPLWR